MTRRLKSERTRTDRTVHGLTVGDRAEIVRYDTGGKWYIEPVSTELDRRQVPIAEAASAAAHGTPHLGRPGGLRFDALVRRLIESQSDGQQR